MERKAWRNLVLKLKSIQVCGENPRRLVALDGPLVWWECGEGPLHCLAGRTGQ